MSAELTCETFFDSASIACGLTPENGVQRNRAAERAAWEWLLSAVNTVSAVYPSVDWSRSVDPALSDEFDLALEGRFWTGTMDEETFRGVWRRWYGAHL